MMALLWAFFAVALGCALVLGFSRLGNLRPPWAGAALVFGVGAAGGMGLTSCIYFVCRLIVPGVPWLGLTIEIILFALAIWNLRRTRRDPGSEPEPPRRIPFFPVLACVSLFVLAMGTAAIAASWDNNPAGDWDAWAIWNLRARFLAAPDGLIQRAWSPQLHGSHPEYPLLTSGFIARCWAYGGGATSQSVPMATAYLFYLAICAVGTAGVARVRSVGLGLLYGLILASTPVFIHEATTQYADVPLACYMLGAVVLATSDQPIVAGLFAGFGAWTKDEGLLFLVVFFVAMALLRRTGLLRGAIGAAAPVAIVLVFKLVLAQGTASLPARAAAGLGPRLADFHRYTFAFGSLAGAFAAMGANLYHPIYPMIAAAALLRFERTQRRLTLFAGLLAAAMLAGYFAVYIVAPDDIGWLIGTTVNRLIVQVWPLLLLTLFMALRTPESLMPEFVPVAAHAARPARKKRK
ncbi:MAG TPA: hypothetical protein VFA04_15755 [Bryobacteraceae bacterium]|nr:hypothetical protein [Bryobacteraceae bacterium]